jgi:hypothetical protein
MVGSLGLSPKLSPLFHSEDLASATRTRVFCSGGLQAGVFGFSGAPLFVPYAAKWDSVFVLQDQQNEHLRKNSRGWCEDL